MVLYILAHLYHETGDLFLTIRKLSECVKLGSPKLSPLAKLRLLQVWDYQFKPVFWHWWWHSPTLKYPKRILFVFLVVMVILMLIAPIFTVFTFGDKQFEFYMLLLGFIIFLIFYPSVSKFKFKDIEISFEPPSMDLDVLPLTGDFVEEILIE